MKYIKMIVCLLGAVFFCSEIQAMTEDEIREILREKISNREIQAVALNEEADTKATTDNLDIEATTNQIVAKAAQPQEKSLYEFDEEKLRGLGFAPGVAAIFMGGDPAIENAAVDGSGILRVERESDVRLGPMFVAHYFFGAKAFKVKNEKNEMVKVNAETKVESLVQARARKTALNSVLIEEGFAQEPVLPAAVVNDFAWGPTAGVELGEHGIRSIGLGLTVGLRKFDVKPNADLEPRGTAFNLTAMWLVEQDVKQLATGLVDGMELESSDLIRYQDRSEDGFAVVFSAGF